MHDFRSHDVMSHIDINDRCKDVILSNPPLNPLIPFPYRTFAHVRQIALTSHINEFQQLNILWVANFALHIFMHVFSTLFLLDVISECLQKPKWFWQQEANLCRLFVTRVTCAFLTFKGTPENNFLFVQLSEMKN